MYFTNILGFQYIHDFSLSKTAIIETNILYPFLIPSIYIKYQCLCVSILSSFVGGPSDIGEKNAYNKTHNLNIILAFKALRSGLEVQYFIV